MPQLESPPLQHVELGDGTTLAFRELGPRHDTDDPAVLLLHGWPTSSHLWRDVMPPIAERHRVLALDLPGFGGSAKPARGRYHFADFEAAIDGFLATAGEDRVAIVGHDIGGPIAAHWALRHPERVAALVLLNTLLYPEFDPTVFEFVATLTTPERRDQLTSPAGLAEFMRSGVVDGRRLDDDVIAAVVAPFVAESDRRALARAGVGLEPAGFEEIARGLPSLRVPVAAIYGEQDRILPDVTTTMSRLQRDVPHATVTALPGCGHFLQEEAPDDVGRLLAEALVQARP
jgi:pimeloyl-ACP methyl ester carboxylesterase